MRIGPAFKMNPSSEQGRIWTLIIATRNAHKVEEIRAILSGPFQFRTLSQFPGAPAVVEDAATFAGNATKKAVELADWLAATGEMKKARAEGTILVLADDSGLEVDALGGAPGVHSARFAAQDDAGPGVPSGNSSDAANNAKLLHLLREVPLEQRTARFRCVLALARVRAATAQSGVSGGGMGSGVECFEGACEGRIEFEARGRGGFGYDPLFVPLGCEQSFAELGEEIKNRLSHRARALERLRGRVC